LAQFTHCQTVDDALYVFDQKQVRTWRSSPKESAHIRDFHAVDVAPNIDRMSIEKHLSKIEGESSAVLREIIRTERIPSGELFADLMVFVAFMAVRVPRIRTVLEDFVDRIHKGVMQAAVSTAAARKALQESMERDGIACSYDEFEQMVQLALSGEYNVTYEQTWYVQEMVRMALALAPELSLRKWRLWIAEDNAPDFICSDSPVTPVWTIPAPPMLPPAFGTPNTIVSVPLSRRICLVSMLDQELPDGRLDVAAVAQMNSITGRYANQLYSAEPDFVWRMRDDRIGTAADLMSALSSKGT